MRLLPTTREVFPVADRDEVSAHEYASRHIPEFPMTAQPWPRVGDSTERLVSLAHPIRTQPAYDGTNGLQGHYPPLMRFTAAERLLRAQANLPRNLRLCVLDAWRPVSFQQTLVNHFGQATTDEGFVSSTTDPQRVPPHVSGGAVDLTIDAGHGALALGSDFDEFTEKSLLRSLETQADPVFDAMLRRVLFWAMFEAGFAPYLLEWWHFSYGDQNWAAYYGKDAALYGAATEFKTVSPAVSPTRPNGDS